MFQINVLLQAFISQLKLEGFALMADMVYVTQVLQDFSFVVSDFFMPSYTFCLLFNVGVVFFFFLNNDDL